MDTTNGVAAIDDVEIEVPVSGEFEVIPTGAYTAELAGFRVVDVPDWKLESKRQMHPDKEPDPRQWEWKFIILDGEYAGCDIIDYTTRSWHENARAHKHAAALLGKSKLDGSEGMSTKKLIGMKCQVVIVVKDGRNGERSYVDKCLPIPVRKPRPQAASTASRAHDPLFDDDGDEA